MKFFVIIAALCVLGGSNAQVTLDFLTENLLNPMLEQINQSLFDQELHFVLIIVKIFVELDALSMLNSQISQLLQGLLGGLGKRSIDGSALALVNQVIDEDFRRFSFSSFHSFSFWLLSSIKSKKPTEISSKHSSKSYKMPET